MTHSALKEVVAIPKSLIDDSKKMNLIFIEDIIICDLRFYH